MRFKASIAVLALLVACKKPKPPPPPNPPAPVEAEGRSAPVIAKPPAPPAEEEKSDFAWVIRSGADVAQLQQKPSTPGKCYLECTVGSAVSWSANTACFGEKADRKFLAADCGRTVVMIPAPPRGGSWRTTQVMRVYK